MNIVFASHSPFDEVFVVGSHHLSKEMAARGHTVWHISPPITPFHLLMPWRRSYWERVTSSFVTPRTSAGLVCFQPFSLVPWQMSRNFLSHTNLFVTTSNIQRALAKAFAPGEIDILIVDDPRFCGLEKILRPKKLFYRLTDFYAAIKHDSSLEVAEQRMLACCAGVIATSQPLLDHALASRVDMPTLLLENGVDYVHFSAPMREPGELSPIPHPRVIYVGAIDFRFDQQIMETLATRFPQVHFVIIGPTGCAKDRWKNQTNIHVLGAKPYQRVPGFLQHSEVGILPLVDNLANSGRSPMKLYEYGAAGLPVLALSTEELKRRKDSFLHLFHSGEDAAEQLQSILNTPTDRQAVSDACRAHTWNDKTETLLKFVTGDLPQPITSE